MDENLERPNYYAILPAEVRYADVSSSAKLLFAEVTALTNKTGTCWASNQYFANLYGVDVKSITRWIKELSGAGLIETRVVKEAGNRRYIRLSTKMSLPIDKNVPTYGHFSDSVTPEANSGPNTKTNTKTNNTPSAPVFSGADNSSADLGPASTARARALLPQLIEIINPKEKPTADRLRVLNGRLKDYTEDDIIAAAKAFSHSDWHKKNKQMSVDNLIAPSKFGRWYAQKSDENAPEAPARDEEGNLILSQDEIRERLRKEEEERENGS